MDELTPRPATVEDLKKVIRIPRNSAGKK